MDPASSLKTLLTVAWLLPLVSFTAIVFWGKYMGSHGKGAGLLATVAIGASCALSWFAMIGVWLPNHEVVAVSHGHHSNDHGHEAGEHSDGDHHDHQHEDGTDHQHQDNQVGSHNYDGPAITQVALDQAPTLRLVAPDGRANLTETANENHDVNDNHSANLPPYYTGEYYTLVSFGSLKLTISWYIDTLTMVMFCMVTLIATCVHIYAMGYMHEELHDVTDREVTLSNGAHLKRPGRYYRFFQYLSLFCFSMLGIIIAGNLAMVFVFWELVGICSYFLIGFYIERHSASTAANKAFIVNRVGDFGMLIGMMALWASVGTFAFGDAQDATGHTLTTDQGEVAEPGLFTQLRQPENDHHLQPTPGVIAEEAHIRGEASEAEPSKAGHWLLLIAGVGVFCGCIGKSAQFPLHVWLPDAMEGPTPVSALVHSATMVAAGVYLTGRFYPVFTPEALLVIAVVGAITLLIAATIAITATDIKRVLAYSTISQLGYMMLSLGIGGWMAGMFHLITHAFFKGLLFMCSGSVIHAVHTNDMTEMGGLRKKMPITAYTMLIGCLAIIGAGIPLSTIGFSGYYSKDAIIEQAWNYGAANSGLLSQFLKFAPVVGAAITAFYMFRLWYMTFAGKPRNQQRYDHAHESPSTMTTPLLILAFFAVTVGWNFPFTHVGVVNLLEQARPAGTLDTTQAALWEGVTIPNEHNAHDYVTSAGLAAFATAGVGLLLATIIYLWNLLNPSELKQTFKPIHHFLWNKWWFDEIYWAIFVVPTKLISQLISSFDRGVIDPILHGFTSVAKAAAQLVDSLFDRTFVDGLVNTFARGTWDFGLLLRKLQTGRLRQYVLFIVVGFLAIIGAFVLFFLAAPGSTIAGG